MAPRRKGAAPLARDRIIEAAIRIIDAEGLDALSMRRLGAELGVNPMAAYYHVPNKAALYDLVLDAVMADVDTAGIDPTTPAAEQVKQAARAYRSAVLRHPQAIPVFVARPLRSATALRPVEPLVGILFAAGLSPDEVLAAVDVVAQYVLGGAMGHYHRLTAGDDTDGGEQGDFDVLDPSDFPQVSRLLAEAHHVGSDAEFEFGLDAMTRGLLDASRYALPPGSPMTGPGSRPTTECNPERSGT